MKIPSRFDREFLDWFRRRTEGAWSAWETRDFVAEGIGGVDWQRGTRWRLGLPAAAIDAAERRWGLQFPPDYRLFLASLHAVDRPMKGARFVDESAMAATDRPAFYDWSGDDDESLRAVLARPLDGLFFDVEHNDLWMPDWGPPPADVPAKMRSLADIYGRSPRLIPIFSHRFLLGEPAKVGNPVFSVYGSDIIVYGADLRSYFLEEWGTRLLGLSEEEVAAAVTPVDNTNYYSIPFWGALLKRNDAR